MSTLYFVDRCKVRRPLFGVTCLASHAWRHMLGVTCLASHAWRHLFGVTCCVKAKIRDKKCSFKSMDQTDYHIIFLQTVTRIKVDFNNLHAVGRGEGP